MEARRSVDLHLAGEDVLVRISLGSSRAARTRRDDAHWGGGTYYYFDFLIRIANSATDLPVLPAVANDAGHGL